MCNLENIKPIYLYADFIREKIVRLENYLSLLEAYLVSLKWLCRVLYKINPVCQMLKFPIPWPCIWLLIKAWINLQCHWH